MAGAVGGAVDKKLYLGYNNGKPNESLHSEKNNRLTSAAEPPAVEPMCILLPLVNKGYHTAWLQRTVAAPPCCLKG